MSSILYDKDVENATNNFGAEPDWGKIIEFCDRIRNSVGPTAMKAALAAIMKRVRHVDENVQLQAVTLLESAVGNCGASFRAEMSSEEVLSGIRTVIKTGSSAVSNQMKALLASWAQEYQYESEFAPVRLLKDNLSSQGVTFPTPRTRPTGTSTQSSSSKEQDDLKRAIELSLKDKASPMTSAYKASESRQVHSTGKRCRALFDFHAAEDNELSFKTGEIIEILDDRDSHWWKGRTHLGSGLFPSNFVTLDLKVDPESKKNADIKQAKARTASTSGKVLQVNEETIDLCLEMLKSAEASGGNKAENDTLKEMEKQCKSMRNLVEKRIAKIDQEVEHLQQLNTDYQSAINLYRQLLSSGLTQRTQVTTQTPINPPPSVQYQPESHPLPMGGSAYGQPQSIHPPVGNPSWLPSQSDSQQLASIYTPNLGTF